MPTPLLPAGSVRNSKRNTKFEYSFCVKRFPPPSAGQTRIPFSTTYPGPCLPTRVQPLRVLPSNKDTNPGSVASTVVAASRIISRCLTMAPSFTTRGLATQPLAHISCGRRDPKFANWYSAQYNQLKGAKMNNDVLRIAGKEFHSRLIIGTGKYKTFQEMARAHEASGAEMVTVAVRRVNLTDRTKESLLDYIDRKKYFILP